MPELWLLLPATDGLDEPAAVIEFICMPAGEPAVLPRVPPAGGCVTGAALPPHALSRKPAAIHAERRGH